jgi:hypothetical protein
MLAARVALMTTTPFDCTAASASRLRRSQRSRYATGAAGTERLLVARFHLLSSAPASRSPACGRHGVGQKPLLPRVLVFSSSNTFSRLPSEDPAEPGLRLVDARVNAVFAAQLGDGNAGLVLLQNPDDLPEDGGGSCSAPCLGPERTSNWIRPKGQGQDASNSIRMERRDPRAKASISVHSRRQHLGQPGSLRRRI